MDYMHPVMAEVLAMHFPPIATETPPDEALRVRADIERQQHSDAIRADRALQEQQQYLHSAGVLS